MHPPGDALVSSGMPEGLAFEYLVTGYNFDASDTRIERQCRQTHKE
jgi:hypothetical protein